MKPLLNIINNTSAKLRQAEPSNVWSVLGKFPSVRFFRSIENYATYVVGSHTALRAATAAVAQAMKEVALSPSRTTIDALADSLDAPAIQETIDNIDEIAGA